MRVFLFGITLAFAAGCAANPTPVPDYPINDEAMQTDVEMLGLDLDPPTPPVEEEHEAAAHSSTETSE